jgi:hypothetical protein|tara:strand:- start:1613 stop:1828 length:216 start_codon:yes stop_codon:yes gene_type:complete
MPNNDINAKFFDIINQEDWDESEINDETPIYRELTAQGDVPLAMTILPTPIPGVWISISLGFEIEGYEDNA